MLDYNEVTVYEVSIRFLSVFREKTTYSDHLCINKFIFRRNLPTNILNLGFSDCSFIAL